MSRMKIKRSICKEIDFCVNPITNQKSITIPGLVMYSIEDLESYIDMLNRVKEVLNETRARNN